MENKENKLLRDISDDITKVELEEYKDKRYREMRKERDRRLGTNLVYKQLIAKFATSAESSKLVLFLIHQFSKLIDIPEYEELKIRFEPYLVDEAAGSYLYQLVSPFKEIIQPVYGSLQYDQINDQEAVVTILYFGDVNPFLGIPFSSRLYKSVKAHLVNLAVFIRSFIGIESQGDEIITKYEHTKKNISDERRRLAFNHIQNRYKLSGDQESSSIHPIRLPSVEVLIDELEALLGKKYSKSSIYDIINKGIKGDL